jgi:hypothetical protein
MARDFSFFLLYFFGQSLVEIGLRAILERVQKSGYPDAAFSRILAPFFSLSRLASAELDRNATPPPRASLAVSQTTYGSSTSRIAGEKR